MTIDRWIEPVLGLPRVVKRASVISLDAGLCVLAVWLALWLRTGEWIALSRFGAPAAFAAVLISFPVFTAFGLYRTVFRYLGWESVVAIVQAVFVYGVIYSAIFTAFAVPGIPRTIGIIQPILLLIGMVGARALILYLIGGRFRHRIFNAGAKNVLIYGAGSAGRQLALALAEAPGARVVGFVDDARDLHGSLIGRLPVFGPHQLAEAVQDMRVAEIYLAIPSARQSRRNEILTVIRSLNVGVRTLPGLLDIAMGKVTVNQLRPLDIEDLLGRDPVAPDVRLLERSIRDKVVLVTGAGGSIGSELCRQIVAMRPRLLILLELSEFALYSIHRELEALVRRDETGTELIPLISSVCDEERVRRVFAAWRPDTVYHAAAYKHVPLVEHNVLEGVRNNVIGTLVCAKAAREFRAGHFILISTDKAVRPTNVMGASKRLAEMVLQAMASEQPDTCFSMVRFGNVLGSSGSVVPLFRQQIAAGGPVTVTHAEVTRYFMTIPEAAQLVLQAGAMARGGDVFVLDMGQPVRIFDLAMRMIELSGLKPSTPQTSDGDIEIEITGLRPGEKLYEELLIGADPVTTGHPRIMMANESFLPAPVMAKRLADLAGAIAAQDVVAVRAKLVEMVSGYQAADHVVDCVAREEGRAKDEIRVDLKRALPGAF